MRRRPFSPVEAIRSAVQERLREIGDRSQQLDHILFVPDGEPTLDARLGVALRWLRPLGLALGVVTNGSLLWRPDVRSDLDGADLVVVRVDAVHEETWRRINRPSPQLRLVPVLSGVSAFARGFRGSMWTETTVVPGINDVATSLEGTAAFVASLRPARAFLSVAAPVPPPPDWPEGHDEALARVAEVLSGRFGFFETTPSRASH
jgi:wyosine [tRNA(Phe)-imidazoG37] synthetase (radical SAM superfamily)